MGGTIEGKPLGFKMGIEWEGPKENTPLPLYQEMGRQSPKGQTIG